MAARLQHPDAGYGYDSPQGEHPSVARLRPGFDVELAVGVVVAAVVVAAAVVAAFCKRGRRQGFGPC